MTTVSIIGGGVVGLSAAVMLDDHPQSDDLDIHIVEKEDTIGSKSTAAAGCGMRTLYRHDTNLKLASRGLQFWSNAESILGEEIGFRRNGYLFLTNDQRREETLRTQSKVQNMNGFTSAVNPELGFSNINLSNYNCRLYLSDSGLASPDKIVSALQSKIDNSSITVHTGTAVLDIEKHDSNWDVVHEDGRLHSDYIVNAAGAWAGEIAEMVGTNLPIWNTRRRLSVLDWSVGENMPLTVDIDTGVYLLPDEDGTLLAGGNLVSGMDEYDENNPESFSDSINDEWNEMFSSSVSDLDPTLASVDVVDSWTGLYTMTESRVPIISKDSRIVHVCGFSGHGIMQAPAAALIVARMICENYSPKVKGLDIKNRADSPDIQF